MSMAAGMLDRPEIKAGLVFTVIVLPILGLGWLLQSVMFPIVISSVLYVLLEPWISQLQRNGLNKTVAIGCVLILLIGLLAWFVLSIVPVLAEQLIHFRERLPHAWENISRLSEGIEGWMQQTLGITIDKGGILPSASGLLQGVSARLISGVSGVVADIALWSLLIPLTAFFLLRDYRSLRNHVISFAPNSIFEEALIIYHKVSKQLELYVRSVMLQSLIMAAMASIGFAMIKLPLALLLGLLAGIFNLIPYVGPLMALAAPILVALSISADPGLLIAVAGVIVVAQLIDNIVVVPTLLARAADLHPLIALFAIIVAGNLFGLVGMVFALPALASARIIYVGVLKELRYAQGLRVSPDRHY